MEGPHPVEELEETRDDVDCDPSVAAGPDRLEQLFVTRLGEGDDHPVGPLGLDDLLKVAKAPEPGQIRRSRVVYLVVDETDRDQAELRVVAELRHDFSGDHPRAEDQSALAKVGGPVQPGTNDGAGDR